MPKKTDDLRDPTPATQGDLNVWGGKLQEDIQEVREDLAKKADKEDLEKFATREDLQQELAKKADKADLEKMGKRIMDHFDKKIEDYLENRAADLLGVKHDEVHLMKQKIKNHEERITVLEN